MATNSRRFLERISTRRETQEADRRMRASYSVCAAVVAICITGCPSRDGENQAIRQSERPTQQVQESSSKTTDDESYEVASQTPSPALPNSGVENPEVVGISPIEDAAANTSRDVAHQNGPDLQFLSSDPSVDSEQLRAEAEQLIDVVTRVFPANPDAFEVRARLLLMLEEFGRAEASWKAALEIAPDYIHAHFGLGQVAMTRDDYPAAIERFRKVIVDSPDYSEELYHELAEAYHKDGELEKSVEVLRDYLKMHPDSAESHLRLGQELLGLKEFESARDAFEQALKISPELPRAQEGLGRALVRLGDRERARELLQAQARARAESREEIDSLRSERVAYSKKYGEIAKVFFAGNQSASGIRILERAVVLDEANMDAWSSLLGGYQRSNQIGNALRMARQMCDVNSQNAGAFFTSGILHAKAGKAEQAIQDLDSAIELAPESHSGYEALARLLLQLRTDLPRTIELATQAVKYRGIAADHELLAQTLAVNGQFERAESELARAIELDPDNAVYGQAMRQLQQFRAGQAGPK